MPFVRHPGIKGLVFEPEKSPSCKKKHDCPDCFFCRQCSDETCRACRKKVKCKRKKRRLTTG